MRVICRVRCLIPAQSILVSCGGRFAGGLLATGSLQRLRLAWSVRSRFGFPFFGVIGIAIEMLEPD